MDHDNLAASRPRRLLAKAALLGPIAAVVMSTGCEMPAFLRSPDLPALPGLPGVYRIDIQQGNVVNRQMLDRLEIGMEQPKVRFILGTPLLTDPFNEDRWDYVYIMRRGSGEETRQRVTLFFVDDRLARIDDRLDPGVAPDISSERTPTLVKVPKRQPREGILDRLVPDFIKDDDEPASE